MRCAENFDLVRQTLFQSAAVWPCGPYALEQEPVQGSGDDWVYYDTSTWAPPGSLKP